MRRPRRLAAGLVGLAASASGLVTLLGRRRRRRGDYRAFVLEYHDVAPETEREGVISSARFRRHLRYLKRRYRIETFAQAAARLADPSGLGEDLAVLTFDDGYAGNGRFAWPVLAEEGARATIFLTTGFLDGQGLWFDLARRGLATALGGNVSSEAATELAAAFGEWPPRGGLEGAMRHLKSLLPRERDAVLEIFRGATLPPAAEPLGWEDVRRLGAEGVEFGAHTVTHPILPTLPRDLQELEIVRSRDRIAEQTGRAPETFSYPNGDHDENSVHVVREAGFTAACTTRKGSNRPGADLFRLRRIGVGSDPSYLLAARLAGIFDEELRRALRSS